MSEMGRVILVGAGPGDAGLLTLRGKEALERADVVLYDRLVTEAILAFIPQSATWVDVGKCAGKHPVPQDEINEMLVRFAKEGKCVVRLKGGDPYLFGRGAEELELILREGIPFEVVPGITSAIAVPAFAGIPVSHRDFASSVHIITAHHKQSDNRELDYESLVKLKGTLIFLMGLGTAGQVMDGLMNAGMAASTPAALIENGTRPNQRKLVATVADIAAKGEREAFQSPAVLIVGKVCGLAERFDWFSKRPLFGTRVIVTRPKGEGTLAARLRELGANVVEFPCIRTQALPVEDAVFEVLAQYGWILFTSPVGADLFFEALKARNVDIRTLYGVRVAAIGAKTAEAIAARGLQVDYVPEVYNAAHLADGLPMDESSGRVLLFRAEEGTPKLASTLRARGFSVDDVAAYQTIRVSAGLGEAEGLSAGSGECIVSFTSVSTVQGFVAALPMEDKSMFTAACIGEETAAEARKHGFRVVVSERATIESLVECIAKYAGKGSCP